MANEEFELEKQKILDKIFLKREDTLTKINEIVEKGMKDFSIDAETQQVLPKPHIRTIPDKITRELIGAFLMKEKGLIKSDARTLSELSSRLGAASTSLSKPLGALIDHGLVKKDSGGNYSIVHHKILEILDEKENAKDK